MVGCEEGTLPLLRPDASGAELQVCCAFYLPLASYLA